MSIQRRERVGCCWPWPATTQKNRAGAEIAVRRALELEPANGRALLLGAMLEIERGQKKSAKQKLLKFLEVEPASSYLREVRNLLSTL